MVGILQSCFGRLSTREWSPPENSQVPAAAAKAIITGACEAPTGSPRSLQEDQASVAAVACNNSSVNDRQQCQQAVITASIPARYSSGSPNATQTTHSSTQSGLKARESLVLSEVESLLTLLALPHHQSPLSSAAADTNVSATPLPRPVLRT